MARYWGQQASGLLIYNQKGQILLLQRSHAVMGGGGDFAVPGGRVDMGDTPQGSARKEGNEEMGGIPKGKFTGSYVFKKPLNVGDVVYLSGESESDPRRKVKRIEKSGENFEYHTFYYLSEEDDWEPKHLNWENDDFEWMDAEKATNDSRVFAPVRDMIKKGFLPHIKGQNLKKNESLKFEDVVGAIGSCLRTL